MRRPQSNSSWLHRLAGASATRAAQFCWRLVTGDDNASRGRLNPWCERDYLIAFDFDPNIIGIATALWVQVRHGQRFPPLAYGGLLSARRGWRRHRRRHQAGLIDANDRINFAATAALCEAVGWSYRRLGGLPKVLGADLLWLAGYRHERVSDHAIGARVRQVVQHSPGVCLRRLADEVGEPIFVLPMISSSLALI